MSFLCFSAVIVLFNFFVDPYKFYRLDPGNPIFHSEDQWRQNPGLAKNHNYTLALIGSSMLEDFIPSSVSNITGQNAINLAIAGSRLKEQSLIAKLALQKSQTNSIIWGLDYFSLGQKDWDQILGTGSFPAYLYDNNPFNDIKYLLNLEVSALSYNLLFFAQDIPQFTIENIHQRTKKYIFGRERVLRSLKAQEGKNIDRLQKIDLPLSFKNIQKYLIPLVETYIHTKFIFYFTPYHMAYYTVQASRSSDAIQDFFAVKNHIIQVLSHYDNVKIYDFQLDTHLMTNHDYYRDLMHHSQDLNSYILNALMDNKHQVTKPYSPEQINSFLKTVVNYKI